MMRFRVVLLSTMIILTHCIPSFAGPIDPTNLKPEQSRLINEHVIGGLPSTNDVYVRKGYILGYNPSSKTPSWVAYHIRPDYRNTPARTGKFNRFMDDPQIEGEATNEDYKGLFTSRGYARGHLAPYAVMGGDRDNDGLMATNDEDDAQTVIESNYMSNIAPQNHNAFNGRPGLWWKLERWIQDDLVVKQGKDVWVFAGCIFGFGEHEMVGMTKDIWVPPMFFKIVIMDCPDTGVPYVLAFLFPHQRSAHGDIQDFLVSVDVIEALSGLNFFNALDAQTEKFLEDQDTWEVWKRLYGDK